jgi:hypothetical protein
LEIQGIAAAACRCQCYGDLKTHLKDKNLDLAQLGKAIVDVATGSSKSKGKKAKRRVWRKKQRKG